jgi:PTH1 family peptidyl-tRNA hydrolase
MAMKYLIIGLGNIGDEYADTRHNIGFITADALALSLKAAFSSGRYASMSKATLRGRTLVMIKPTTFMNLSGKAVRYWMQKEDIPLENILVIVDDLALPLGALRMRKKGSDGGHNGYQVDYVLGRWSTEEEKVLVPRIEMVVDMIKSFALVGPDRTMNVFNKR